MTAARGTRLVASADMDSGAQVSATISARDCPICRGHRVFVLHYQPFALAESSPLPRQYEIVACAACGGVFADTPALQDVYDKYYADYSKYADPAVATGGGDTALDLRRLDETAATLSGLPLARGRQSRVLDVGCAGGGLLRALRSRGFKNVVGLDPSSACIARLRTDGLTGLQGSLSNPAGLGQADPFDLVVLSHVLEHIVNVHSVMDAVRSMLRPAGLLYVEVPDASRYANFPFVPYYYFDSEHINHFDSRSLSNVASATGYTVIAAGAKELALGDGRYYPACWAALKPADVAGEPEFNGELRQRVAQYICQSSTAENHSDLEALAQENRPVVLWGSGSHAQRLLARSPLARCRIVSVIDSDHIKQGQQFAGVVVQDPETLFRQRPSDAVIVIASVLHANAIAANVRAGGLSNKIVIAR